MKILNDFQEIGMQILKDLSNLFIVCKVFPLILGCTKAFQGSNKGKHWRCSRPWNETTHLSSTGQHVLVFRVWPLKRGGYCIEIVLNSQKNLLCCTQIMVHAQEVMYVFEDKECDCLLSVKKQNNVSRHTNKRDLKILYHHRDLYSDECMSLVSCCLHVENHNQVINI